MLCHALIGATVVVATTLARGAALPRSNAQTSNSSYHNPIIPGWHSDPSCTFVQEFNNTFFCTSSTFGSWPGLPIHASKDLINWKLVSHALNRKEQIPLFNTLPTPTFGIFAPTLRYHEGKFYLITFDVEAGPPGGLLFETTDPFDDSAWSIPTFENVTGIDPDIFWDPNNSNKPYVASTAARFSPPGIGFNDINITTGEVDGFQYVWNGTGGASPEGPHMYWKDGYYYLMIAEGGTERYHEEDIARSKLIDGPYESNPSNPILTNANTTRYFQSVGHADMFPDANGNWWAVALARRSGPGYVYAPMSRETVLTPVTWTEDGWPVMSVVEGNMTGPLPPACAHCIEQGESAHADERYTFPLGSTLPRHFLFYGIPDPSNYVVSPDGHQNTLALTAIPNATVPGLSFVGRLQTDTLFTYKVRMAGNLKNEGDEAGASVFTALSNRIDMGLTIRNGTQQLYFKPLNGTAETSPQPQYKAFSGSGPIDLQIQALNQTTYKFCASSQGSALLTAYASSELVTLDFIGAQVGVYANGQNSSHAYFSRWSYTSNGQTRY